jgi:hypothetical protein
MWYILRSLFTARTGILTLGRSGQDLGGGLVRVLLEVLVEELTKLGDLLLEIGGAGPALRGVEELIGNTRAGLGDGEVEGLVDLVLLVGELARVDGVEDCASVLERATLAVVLDTGTGPASVKEPGVGVVRGDLLCKHGGVLHGVKGQERLGEARREGGLGLGDTLFGTGHLRGVARDEVVHGLLGAELGDRRQDTTGVACEENNVGRVAAGDAGNLGVLDVLDGVCATSVLSESGVVVIDGSGLRVKDNVLEDGAELDGVEDIGLLLSGEANALGVAAALNVEDASVTPAVLVVTNQGTLGVGREGCLASSGETEEDGDVSVLALVGGRVESKDVVLDGHLVVEDSEDALLHLSCVLSSKNDHLLLGEVDRDGCGGGHTSGPTVSRESTGIVDHVVGVEVFQLLAAGPDEHVTHEESMVGTSADNTNVDAVALVPAGETIDNVDAVTGVEVVDSTLAVDTPHL